MTTATLIPAPRQAAGATAVGTAPRSSHPVGSALRAVKVFAAAVVSVVILGEYSN
ncbi:hypothetical protein [Streptomyces beijiangensis]|uniref:Uncharacterized protein n=1 Tax=Streptomyces beijiangensis TaxID=163361 RepID=A0A939FDB7_9ACTN|nr:hypothetical protein [Streptomyces beijiangensis]MBO0516116.1 hypothetical protein [Streptomyces beijiangensis]